MKSVIAAIMVGWWAMAGLSPSSCGGTAVIDGPVDPDGTATATGTVTGTNTSTGSGTGTATSTATQTGTDCVNLCTILYDCGKDQDRCPSFEDYCVTLDDLLYGNSGDACVYHCQTDAELAKLITPGDCDATVANVKAASPEFTEICEQINCPTPAGD